MLTTIAIIMPIKPMKRNEPQPDRSFLVVYAHRLIPAKVPAVMKKTRATLAPVNVMKMVAIEMPIKPA